MTSHTRFFQDLVGHDKEVLQTSVERAHLELSQMKDQHRTLLEHMQVNAQQYAVVCEDKVILEQQAAAITAEHLHHVVGLEDKISSLTSIHQQQNLQVADQRIKVALILN